MNERAGYRAYLATRPVRGVVTPQRVQNLVVRDYATRNGLPYLMNVSEFAMSGCYMMLENALSELDRTLGIIAFSAFMLPPEEDRRRRIYRRVLDAGASLHAALENLSVRTPADIQGFEDVICTALLLDRTPFRGRYEKAERSLAERDERFSRAILSASTPSVVAETM